jgi:adenylate cyclase
MATAASTSGQVSRRKFPAFSLLVCIGCVAALLALAYPPLRKHLDSLEYWTADWRTVLLADRVAGTHPKIVIVLFDRATFGGVPIAPIPRDVHAKVLRAIDSMGPRAIGLDFYYLAPQDPDKDRVFIETLRDAKTPVVLGALDQHTNTIEPGSPAYRYQQRFLADIGRPAGYISLKYDAGQIVRRTFEPAPGSAYHESFPRQVVMASGLKLSGPGTTSDSMHIAWLLGTNWNPTPFYTISAKELLPGADPARREEVAKRIKGSIVLTGYAMPNADLHDTALTVWTDEKMLGVYIHAHVIAQLIDGRYFFDLEGERRWGFLLAVALIGFVLGWVVPGKWASWLNLSIATAILVAADATCYYFLRTVLPFTLALYLWFIAVLLGQHLRRLLRWAIPRPLPAAAD